jgi:hypothetical protein
MGEEEIKEFVLSFCDGGVYSSNHIEQRHVRHDGSFNDEGWANDVRMCFLPVAFGCLNDVVKPPEEPEPLDWDAEEEYEEKKAVVEKINETYFKAVTAQLGIIWEWERKSLPRGINGMPMFMSCKLMHKDDWSRALKAIRAEWKRREDIQV